MSGLLGLWGSRSEGERVRGAKRSCSWKVMRAVREGGRVDLPFARRVGEGSWIVKCRVGKSCARWVEKAPVLPFISMRCGVEGDGEDGVVRRVVR